MVEIRFQAPIVEEAQWKSVEGIPVMEILAQCFKPEEDYILFSAAYGRDSVVELARTQTAKFIGWLPFNTKVTVDDRVLLAKKMSGNSFVVMEYIVEETVGNSMVCLRLYQIKEFLLSTLDVYSKFSSDFRMCNMARILASM